MTDNGNRLLVYKRIVHFNNPGHAHFLTFSCYQRLPLLADDRWRAWLAECVHAACDRHEYALWAYVFMLDHVHLLVKPRREKYDISLFLKSVKLAAAKRILAQFVREGTPMLERLRVVRPKGKGALQFWQAGPGYDKNIWDMEMAVQEAQYCHRNPVKRGLVKSPDEWRWSSFRWLEMGIREGEPLALGDWDERTLPERAAPGHG
jgi:putative transposase